MMESKGKVVNFRVTNGEYVSYCRACSAAGLNNLSEMLRAAMSQFVSQRNSAAAGQRDPESPGAPVAAPSGPIAESGATEDRRTVYGRDNGRPAKQARARSAAKGIA
jgi:hypothetical protein